MSSMRLLCFGDSLTEGYTTPFVMYPYSQRLRELLSEHLKKPVEVDTMGVSGEMVIDTMVNRLEKTLTDAKSSYNWIVILGGTNDLGTGADADKLLAALSQMHDRARATGARTAVLTIPQFALELGEPGNEGKPTPARIVSSVASGEGAPSTGSDPYWGWFGSGTETRQMPGCESLRNRKAKVNAGLREYCATSGGQSICVDVFNELPHATLSPEERKKFWCDGLHCTPHGYDRMAEIIFDALEKYL